MKNLLKHFLEEGDCIEFSNDDDLLQLHFNFFTHEFFAVLNAKCMFSYKTFKTFEKKVFELANKRGIEIHSLTPYLTQF